MWAIFSDFSFGKVLVSNYTSASIDRPDKSDLKINTRRKTVENEWMLTTGLLLLKAVFD